MYEESTKNAKTQKMGHNMDFHFKIRNLKEFNVVDCWYSQEKQNIII